MISAGLWLVFASLVLVYFVYDGYGRALQLLRALRRTRPPRVAAEPALPTVTVVIPAFNEENRIRAKLENVLGQDFPRERLEVVVISDGSTDTTNAIVAEYGNEVQLLRSKVRLGKSLAQNEAVVRSRGEIIVLTDSAVAMERSCLRNLVLPFADESVGCVSARLSFGASGSVTGADQNRYWKYELKLRRLESDLGLLATAAGPAMAIRRCLWRELQAEYGDDCVLPLDVVLQGKFVVHAQNALARDESFASARQEFRARIRMTVRNWAGTFSRGALLNPLRHPGYAFALWSHKILRWLSPLFMLGLIAGTALIGSGGGSWWPLAIVLCGLGAGAAGIVGLFRGARIPLLATAGSFLLANAAFLVGLIMVMRGQTIRVYQNQ